MPMKTVAFICQKGGTAKTTSAINLAVEALAYGLKVVLIDLDPQVSASNWFDLRENPEPAVIAPQVPHLKRVLAQAAANGADLAIIDTAGHSNDAALGGRQGRRPCVSWRCNRPWLILEPSRRRSTSSAWEEPPYPCDFDPRQAVRHEPRGRSRMVEAIQA